MSTAGDGGAFPRDATSTGAMNTTIRVKNIPAAALAGELSDYFSSLAGPVYACEIASFHRNWGSRGFGRVQFETLAATQLVLNLASANKLPLFQLVQLNIEPSFDDIVARSVDSYHRFAGGKVFAGYLAEERKMVVVDEWVAERVEVMPERKRLDVIIKDRNEKYKLEIGYGDIIASFACGLEIFGRRHTAVLLQLRYAPKIFQRLSGPALNSKFKSDRYHVCAEDLQCIWVRTVDFSNNCAIGRSSYLCVEIPEQPSATDILRRFPFASQFGDLTLTKVGPFCSHSKLVPIINPPDHITIDYEILFQLNSLVHLQKISYGQVSTDLFYILNRQPVDTAMKILKHMHDLKTTCYDPVRYVRNQVVAVRSWRASSKKGTRGNLMSCYRLLITPSRVYFLGPELETANYIVNHYSAYASDFLRVSFVDEDWGKLFPDALSTDIEHGLFCKPYKTDIYRRISSILKEGLCIGQKKFEFLAFSASQLRGGSVWMFASNDNVTAGSIRDWMGQFNKIYSISKCAARMGQLFSSSLPTVNVPLRDVQMIEDVEIVSDGVKYCFSDGIGKISQAFAKEIAKICGLKETPSAFQIRYGGFKGVVAVDRTSFQKLSLRGSMRKFDSGNTMLNITKWSDYLPCYLNREIISLLSTLGIKDEVFESMQHAHICHLNQILTNRDVALRELGKLGGGETKIALNLLTHGYEPETEPYLMMILRAYRENQLLDIRSRCRIFVPKGRVLLGCLDETRTINYGQVYVRVTLTADELKDRNQTFFSNFHKNTAVIVGKVVVTKNPCLHPGDVRVLDAVYEPCLDDMCLVDCLIFPQKGERPHPNECSGGDLDGDLYFVCWDENLIPGKADAPMDYVGRRPRIMDHEVTLEEIQNFFLDYMINDNLGAIANAHLVHADREEKKARSLQCLLLANLHSAAVDFAKTGSPAEMPRVLRPKQFPDFMERWDRPMYTSSGVLGKLYRAAIHGTELADSRTTTDEPPIYDPDLEVQGFDAFLEEAEDYRDQYSERLSAIMNYYGAEREDEILTGNLRKKSMYLQKDKQKYADMKDRIQISVRNLHKEVETWFKESCDEGESAKMASAWYHVTYHPNYYSASNFLSFPWILSDILLNTKDSSRRRRNPSIPAEAI